MDRSLAGVVIAISLCASANAHAGLMQFKLEGEILTADAGNAFGLSAGDIVSMIGTFDESLYQPSGFVQYRFGQGTGNTLEIHLGLVTLNETQDSSYAGGIVPRIFFIDDVYSGSDIVITIGTNGAPVKFVSTAGFEGTDAADLKISGRWTDVEFAAVPEPSSISLMAIGLAGFGGIACRMRRQASKTRRTFRSPPETR